LVYYYFMNYLEQILSNIPNGLYILSGIYFIAFMSKLYFERFKKLEFYSIDHEARLKEQEAARFRIEEKLKKLDTIEKDLNELRVVVDRIARHIISKDSLDPEFFKP